MIEDKYITINVTLHVLTGDPPMYTEGPYKTKLRVNLDRSTRTDVSIDGDYDNDYEIGLDVEK